MSVGENLLEIKKKLGKSATLIAVSKTFSIDLIKEAYSENVEDFGENYLDEALEKIDFFKSDKKYGDLKWHFLGRVQSKKINKMVGVFDYIHTLASIDHLKKIQRSSEEKKVAQKILIQVKHEKDERDYGVVFNKLEDFLNKSLEFSNINYAGLMYLPPQGLSMKELENSFSKVSSLFNDFKMLMQKKENDWNMISMGMSDDYELAVKNGSTHVRIGRGVFGARESK